MGRERKMKDTGRERTFVVEILEKEPSTFFFFFFDKQGTINFEQLNSSFIKTQIHVGQSNLDIKFHL